MTLFDRLVVRGKTRAASWFKLEWSIRGTHFTSDPGGAGSGPHTNPEGEDVHVPGTRGRAKCGWYIHFWIAS